MELVGDFIVLLSHTQSLYTKLHNPKEFVKIAFINCHLDSNSLQSYGSWSAY